MTILELARKFTYVRELPGNKGNRVEGIQKWCGGAVGQSWCGYWLTMVLDIYFEGKAPLGREGSCDRIMQLARDNGWLVTDPLQADIYLRLETPTDAVHVGFVVPGSTMWSKNILGTLSGNTSKDAQSVNGDGVYEKAITAKTPSKYLFIRLPGVLTP